MSNSVSVDEAIQKGHKVVTYPSLLIIAGILILSFSLAIMEVFPVWTIAIGFILASVLPWLYWGLKITKWRLWAFDNVRNVHELQRKAIEENLIWEEGHIIEVLEIKNDNDKLKWKELQEKFYETDIFNDDYTLPTQTFIFTSKRRNFILLLCIVISFLIGIFNLFNIESFKVGGASLLLFCFFCFLNFKKTKKKEPQIILDENGIQTLTSKLYKWSEIKDEVIVNEGTYRLPKNYLTYRHPDGIEKLQIDDLAIEKKNLENLIRIYRGRSNFDDKEKAISSFFRTNK